MKFNMRKFFCFVIVSLFCFSFTYFVTPVSGDEIWNYGFGYNIAFGLVPYRDFNMVLTPLYSMFVSIFIRLFGHHLYSIHIFNSIILSSLILICYHKLGIKSLLFFPFIFLVSYPGYNLFCVFVMILLLVLLDSNLKRKDTIIAFLVGLLFLTKQTIGVCLFLPMMYYSKNKIKDLFVFLIPILLLIIYLLVNNALYDFINYCFLGLFEFCDSNKIYMFLIIEIVVCLIIIFYFVKSKFKNKKLFYILMFQVVTVPIIDDYHFMIGLLPVLYYFLLVIKIPKFKIKYYFIMVCYFCFMLDFHVQGYGFEQFYSDKTSYLYGRNVSTFLEDKTLKITKYIDNIKDDYDYVYLFSSVSYYIKLNANYPLSKYDLINNGNMGYNGANRYIDEIDSFCANNKCAFILNKYEIPADGYVQTNIDILNHIPEHYSLVDNVDNFDIYTN